MTDPESERQPYTLTYRPAAARQLRKLPREVQQQIKSTVDTLLRNPRPVGVIKVQNADEWRVRSGNYRVTYVVDDKARIVRIAWVGHRKDAYRDLS